MFATLSHFIWFSVDQLFETLTMESLVPKPHCTGRQLFLSLPSSRSWCCLQVRGCCRSVWKSVWARSSLSNNYWTVREGDRTLHHCYWWFNPDTPLQISSLIQPRIALHHKVYSIILQRRQAAHRRKTRSWLNFSSRNSHNFPRHHNWLPVQSKCHGICKWAIPFRHCSLWQRRFQG